MADQWSDTEYAAETLERELVAIHEEAQRKVEDAMSAFVATAQADIVDLRTRAETIAAAARDARVSGHDIESDVFAIAMRDLNEAARLNAGIVCLLSRRAQDAGPGN